MRVPVSHLPVAVPIHALDWGHVVGRRRRDASHRVERFGWWLLVAVPRAGPPERRRRRLSRKDCRLATRVVVQRLGPRVSGRLGGRDRGHLGVGADDGRHLHARDRRTAARGLAAPGLRRLSAVAGGVRAPGRGVRGHHERQLEDQLRQWLPRHRGLGPGDGLGPHQVGRLPQAVCECAMSDDPQARRCLQRCAGRGRRRSWRGPRRRGARCGEADLCVVGLESTGHAWGEP
mmetsp:Transcript_92935/g.278802  ORF Transcript_92935/g.278802 Transcript_92935/m.278802 type:complete len:232 (+) Transcript_92935:201-896(+)